MEMTGCYSIDVQRGIEGMKDAEGCFAAFHKEKID